MDQFEEGAVSRREGDFSVVVEPIKEYIVDHWEYSVLWYVWRGSVGTKDEALRKGRAMNEAQAIGEARTFIMRQ